MNITITYAEISAFMTPKTNGCMICVTNDVTENTPLCAEASETFGGILRVTTLEQNQTYAQLMSARTYKHKHTSRNIHTYKKARKEWRLEYL